MWMPVGEKPQQATTNAMAKRIFRVCVEGYMVDNRWVDAPSIRSLIIRNN